MKKLALVTGGTRGIGKGISVALSKAGYDVAVTYQSGHDAAEAFSRETGIKVFSWDVSDFNQCADGVKRVEDTFGKTVDILVNNAGITRDGMMHKMSFEMWNAVIKTNLDSVFNMSRAVIIQMRDKGFGRIVNISSVNGIKGQVGQANYSAAKAGIIGFSKALAQESAAKGITVNVVAPGYVDTDMTLALREDIRNKITETIPVKRFGQVDEIADAVLFLVNEPFITGATININGGQYMI